TDFRCCDSIVLVDDREGSESEEGFERCACVQVAAAALTIFQCEQYLRDCYIARFQQLLVCMGEPDLPDRRCRLTLFQAQAALGQSQMTSPQRNGSGGDENDLLTALAQAQ